MCGKRERERGVDVGRRGGRLGKPMNNATMRGQCRMIIFLQGGGGRG